jgi:cell wall assembly regulator SMI1
MSEQVMERSAAEESLRVERLGDGQREDLEMWCVNDVWNSCERHDGEVATGQFIGKWLTWSCAENRAFGLAAMRTCAK